MASVFDIAGRVVGTHGQGDREDIVLPVRSNKRDVASREQVSSEEAGITNRAGIPAKTGFNLGIPTEVFLASVPNAKQKLGIKFDDSKPELIALRGGDNKAPKPGVIDITDEASTDIDDGANESTETNQPSLPKASVTPSAAPVQPNPVRTPSVKTPSVKTPSRSRVW